jgi:hypothetical protein
VDEFHDFGGGFRLLEQKSDQAVIRQDEELIAHASGDGTPGSANPGVDHRHVNGSGREIRHGTREDQRPLLHILRRDEVAQVSNLRFGGDFPDDALHDAHVAVFEAEVG